MKHLISHPVTQTFMKAASLAGYANNTAADNKQKTIDSIVKVKFWKNNNHEKFEVEWMQHLKADLKQLCAGKNQQNYPVNEAFVEMGNTNANKNIMEDTVERSMNMLRNYNFDFDEWDDIEEENDA